MRPADETELAALLRQSLIRHSRVPLPAIRDEDVIMRDLGYDSFALLNVILDLEDTLSIEIASERLAALREIDFRGFVALVAEHLRPREGEGGIAAA